MFDLGDPVPLSVNVKNAAGTLENATTVVLTVTLPDATTATPSVTNVSAGVYTASYPTTQAGRHTVRWVATGTNASAFTDAFDVDEAAPTGIVSLADVRARQNFTATTSDEEIRDYIDRATDFIESRIGPVVRRTVVKVVTPSGGKLFLNGPAVSLTSVTSAYGFTRTYDVSTMFLDASRGVVRPQAFVDTFCWPVTVTYVAGRVIVPSLIRQAALDYIAWLWEGQRGATALPIGGGEFEVTAPQTVPYKILQALEPYAIPLVA